MSKKMPALHAACSLFPELAGEEFDALVEDIREHGLREAVWVYDGKILDGRNRWAACKVLGIEPKTREFRGTEEGALLFAVSVNMRRRHLRTEQKIGVLVRLTELLEALRAKATARQAAGVSADGKAGGRGKRKENLGENLPQGKRAPRARDEAGAMLGMSGRSVASGLRAAEVPALLELMDAGKIAVHVAASAARLPPKQLAKVVAAAASGNKKIAAVVHAAKREQAMDAVSKRVPVTAVHVVHVGDAVEQLAALKAGSAHCCVMDPPYGIDVHRTRGGGKDYADGESYALELLDAVCVELKRVLSADAHVYVFSGYSHVEAFKRILAAHFALQDNPIVWVKNKATMADRGQWYASRHEYVLFARRSKARPLTGNHDDVIECATEPGFHSAAKPTALLRRLIEASTLPGELVVDPFCGSGRTLLAAKLCGRAAVGIECDAKMAKAARGTLA